MPDDYLPMGMDAAPRPQVRMRPQQNQQQLPSEEEMAAFLQQMGGQQAPAAQPSTGMPSGSGSAGPQATANASPLTGQAIMGMFGQTQPQTPQIINGQQQSGYSRGSPAGATLAASLVGNSLGGGLGGAPAMALGNQPQQTMQVTNGGATSTYGFGSPFQPGLQLMGQQNGGQGIPSGATVSGYGGQPPGLLGQGDVNMGVQGLPGMRAFLNQSFGGMPEADRAQAGGALYAQLLGHAAPLMNSRANALQATAQYGPGGLAQQGESRLTAQAQHGMDQSRVQEQILASVPGMVAAGIPQADAEALADRIIMGLRNLTPARPALGSSPASPTGTPQAARPGAVVPSPTTPDGGGNQSVFGNPARPPAPYRTFETDLNRAAQMGPRNPETPGQRPLGNNQTPGVPLERFLSNLQAARPELLADEQNFRAIQQYIGERFSPAEIQRTARGMPESGGILGRILSPIAPVLPESATALSPEQGAAAAYHNRLAELNMLPPGVSDRRNSPMPGPAELRQRIRMQTSRPNLGMNPNVPWYRQLFGRAEE